MLLMIRTLSVLLGIVALVAFSPAGLAAKKKKPSCAEKKEQVGCKLKSAEFAGSQTAGGSAYGVRLTIGSPFSRARGVMKGSCTGGPPRAPDQPPVTQVPLIGFVKLPKTLTVGTRYSKSGSIDRTENTGQVKVRLQATESVKVKILSGKRARVEISTKQTTQNVDPPPTDPPRVCSGTGVQIVKRI